MIMSELFKDKKPTLSFEVFPPKKDGVHIPLEKVFPTMDELVSLNPSFISVTYGAGGGKGDSVTCGICRHIASKGVLSMAHLTCVNSAKEDIDRILDELESSGIENILALRGDIVPNIPPKKDFSYASQLISYISERGGFHISAACYPEGHINAPDLVTDIRHLKEKVDAGAEHLISQLFFDNSAFFRFRELTAAAGINVPIEAGIMPVVNKKQIERMVSICGASLPAKFSHTMARFENNPEALRDAGIAYAVNQIVELIAEGVDGVHIYTMNNPYVAKRICDSVSSLL
ncbi:MAG: methylenetetrahydrofolate reductase [NAD(P)H] [Oscillospiraceae bacterium]|nr:methylenetetrahydrofolate reductase [NAD(P)H] [Oscillospiraceae bacterium]